MPRGPRKALASGGTAHTRRPGTSWKDLLDAGQRPGRLQAAQIVAIACARYFIERAFQDAKTSLGLADDQTRGWLAWHHHMALVMLAMQFQLHERMLHAQAHPLLSTADIVELLRHQLPADANHSPASGVTAAPRDR